MRCLSSRIVLALLVGLAAAHAAQEPIPLNDYIRLGQRFTASGPFDGIWVIVPSWSDSEGGLTLTLWDSPQRTRRLASKTFTDVADNARLDLRVRRALPAGKYYWEIDQRTGRTRIGLYAEILDADTDDCAYLDGVPNRRRRFLSGTLPGPMLFAPPEKLIAVLRSGASHDDQVAACRQLAVVGTRQSVPVLARLLGDRKLAHMARFALEPMPGGTVDAAFRAALSQLQGDLLVGVINSVGVRGDPQAVGPLSRLLRSADVAVARAAAVALGRIGTASAAAVLTKAMGGAAPGVRAALYEGGLECARGLMRRADPARAAALYDRLRAPQAPRAVRVAAMRGAIEARRSAGLPLLLAQLRGRDPDLATAALWLVPRALPGPNVTRALVELLPQVPADRQPALVQALGRRGDRMAVPCLRDAATTAPKPVRLAALRALAALDGTAAVPVLVRALNDEDGEVAQAARDGVAILTGSQAAAAAQALLGQNDARSQLCGIEIVVGRSLSRFVPALLQACRTSDPQVRVAALKALAGLASANDLPGLLAVLPQATDPQALEAAEQALAAACSRAGDPEACAAKLMAGLAAAPPPQRAALLRVLASLGGATALQSVRQALRDADPDVRATALEMLCAWKTPDAAPDLLALARTADAASDRVRGLRGLLRIAGDPDVPADQRLALCQEAASLAQRDEERRLLLGALGGIPSLEALRLIAPHLAAEGTKAEASAAALAVAAKVTAGPEVIAALEQVVQAAATPELVQRAQALLQEVRAKAGTQ